ncbi:hypothetical protein AKJ40_01790 [candidate division MSBL1 archaeon SCGC-AAA259M10]|uniref:RCK C-terminal domain-containing protein n=1 Tax=candidate division MSBL1 archaeon SCGC-AAA259M10 TaxID=1698270 RepID=A0A133V158_9EURY|nr:hypothetical protein AKJ40_01790 [candidate division MSBL1 archaeon SCGC-AAA259M10]
MSPRCKRAEELDIDNCHEDYGGEKKYCLFHRPEKNYQDKIKFLNAIEEKADELKSVGEFRVSFIFKTSINFAGYIFPPMNFAYGGLEEDSLSFKKAEFRSGANSIGAVFEGKAEFQNASFHSTVSFTGVEFIGKANFRNTTFEAGAFFAGKSLEKKVTQFNDEAHFNEATFIGSANFDGVYFKKGAYFTKTKFKKSCLVYQTNAGIEEAESLVALTSNDETNLMVCKVAKDIASCRVIARVKKDEYADMYKDIGADIIVSAISSTVGLIEKAAVSSGLYGMITMGGKEGEVIEIKVSKNSEANGKAIKDLNLPKICTVGLIRREGELIAPRGDTVFEEGDQVILVGKSDEIISTIELFHP